MNKQNLPPPTERELVVVKGVKGEIVFWIMASILILAFYGNCFGQNFTTDPNADKTYIERAEKARRELAIFWTGKKLPGNWSSSCPIKLKVGNIGAGGATNFNFDRGHVFGWSMSVQGTRERILDSVIPHEVNHMIFASLLRHPLTRWLDEGCSMLFEHASEHERFRKQSLEDENRYGTMLKYFDGAEYPSRMQDVIKMYASGFTFIEWMLEQEGRERLFEFVKDLDKPSVKMSKHYGMSAETAVMNWHLWMRGRVAKCEDANCRMHHRYYSAYPPMDPAKHSKPILHIVGAPWCTRCKPFEFSYQLDPSFRKKLQSKWIINFINGDLHPRWVRDHNVTGYPTFIVSNRKGMIAKYPGKRKLIAALEVLPLNPNTQWQPVEPRPPPTTDPVPVPKAPKPPAEAQVPTITVPAFDEEGFTKRVFGQFKEELSTRFINQDEKFSGYIDEQNEETDSKIEKVAKAAETAATVATYLGFGVPGVGAIGLGIWGAKAGIGLYRRRKKRKKFGQAEVTISGESNTSGLGHASELAKQVEERLKALEKEKRNKVGPGPSIQNTTESAYKKEEHHVPSVIEALEESRQQVIKLEEVIRDQENEISKVRKYIPIPVHTDVELYRQAIDIVVEDNKLSNTVQKFHHDVEWHFKLLKSGRGV